MFWHLGGEVHGQQREFVGGGAVRINGEQVKDNRAMEASDLLHGRMTLLKRGKKLWRAVNWT